MAEKNINSTEEALENLEKAKQDLQNAKSTYTFIDKQLSKKNGIFLMNNENTEKDPEIKKTDIDNDEEIKKIEENEKQIEKLEEKQIKEEKSNDFLVINLSIIGIIVFGAFQFLKN